MKGANNSEKKIIIRKVEASDAKSLVEFINKVGGESDFLTFGLGEFGRSVEQEKDFIEGTLSKKNALLIVAEIDDKIVGNLNFSGGLRERTAHVGEFGVSVLREYWGIGIGEELIKYLINWSKDLGIIRKINLRVRTDNTRGIKLYKKLGFLEEGIAKRDFSINGEFYDSMLMGLHID